MANVGNNPPAAPVPEAPPTLWPARAPKATEVVSNIAIVPIPGYSDLPSYDILNGDPSTNQPYLQRSTISAVYFWCPVRGINPQDALKYMDAFIRVHLYNVHMHAPTGWDASRKRKTAIILGITRAVMTSSYLLIPESFVPGETAEAFINVVTADDGSHTYDVLATPPPARGAGPDAPAPVDHTGHLSDDLALTQAEQKAIGHLIKIGTAILPIQGHNLLAEGHHYLSGAGRAGSRACTPIEKQIITDADMVDWFALTEPDRRDLIWHKTGHPVNVAIKLSAATSKKVVANLKSMDMGAAVARLPAVESEARPISAYLKCTNMVRSIVETHGGRVENSIFEDVLKALEAFPIGAASVPDPDDPRRTLTMMLGSNMNPQYQLEVTNRQEVLDFIRRLVPRVQDNVAIAFGFYSAMSEAAAMSGVGGRMERGGDSLMRAYSLVKLKSECMAAFHQGTELYADYRAKKQKDRSGGDFSGPSLDYF